MNHGDGSSLQMERFMALYRRGPLFTLDIMRQHNRDMRNWSVQHNPYYFSAVRASSTEAARAPPDAG